MSTLRLPVECAWLIEQFYEEAKEGCGLGDDQGRRWDGFHRHLALVMVAYRFLVTWRMSPLLSHTEPFPPLPQRRSLPAVQREIMRWLRQDLVLWWIEIGYSQTFRSRRK